MSNEKKAQWICRALTAPLVVTMMRAGFAPLAGLAANVQGITHPGYPAYVSKMLGAAKLVGGLAILFGRFRTLKEWSHAGYILNLAGASPSHALAGAAPASCRLWKRSSR
jgi:hypothetical protein